MEKRKKDRRIRKTEDQLRKGLLELLKEKKIQNITVQELVDKVDMNRSTFYLHYKDIYDLLEHIENSYFGDFNAFMDSHQIVPDVKDVKDVNDDKITSTLIDYFEFLKENEDLITVLIGYNGDPSFSKRQVEILISTIYDWLYDTLGIAKNQQNDDVLHYCTAGCIGLVRRWVMNGYKEEPESIGQLMSDIITFTAHKFLVK